MAPREHYPITTTTTSFTSGLMQPRISVQRRRMIGDLWIEQQTMQSQRKPNAFSYLACRLPGCCSTIPTPGMLYCSAVAEDEGDASVDSEISEGSISKESVFGVIGTKTSMWKDVLLQYSNYASALCVLDCTILPVVTVLLPLMGFAVASSTMHWMHHAGHQLALYFVLPVGFTATTTNYFLNHRTAWITALGWLGLLLIFGSNTHIVHGGSTILHRFLHVIHHDGVAHRIANLTGCALLMGSNYLSRRRGCGNANCKHDH